MQGKKPSTYKERQLNERWPVQLNTISVQSCFSTDEKKNPTSYISLEETVVIFIRTYYFDKQSKTKLN